jgi:hypothetical protein
MGMKSWMIAVLCLAMAIGVMAQPPDDTATCAISVTVGDIMEWSDHFPDIDLATMTTQAAAPTGTQTTTLYTNGNVDITADNTDNSQLTDGTDTLVTSYSLAYDGNGVAATGGSSVAYTLHSSFLSSASVVTHVSLDGAVIVTLGAMAQHDVGNVADAGDYTATQTLTASWGTQ